MSGIDRITAKIIEQAKLQAENRMKYAEEDALKAKAALKKRFDRTMEAEKIKAGEEGNEAARRIIANVKLEGRKKKLAARQDAVNLVFSGAVKIMVELPEKDYTEFMGNLALPYLSEGENVLIMNEKDSKSIGAKLIKILNEKEPSKNVSLAEENIRTIGGLIVKRGDIQTNLTLESIIRLEREKLESEVVDILFESE